MGVVYEKISDKLLNETFTNVFRSGYISVKGTTVPERYKDLHNSIENFTVNEDDIWICSFPKTGTTWTQEMVWMIMNNLDLVGAQTNLSERFPFLDFSFLFDYRSVLESNKDFQVALFQTDSIKYIENKVRPRFIKTHLPWNLLPKQIQNGIKCPKIIYIARNPKDTCVSYYHHCKLLEGYKGNFDDFCNMFLSGRVNYGCFWTNVLQFWDRRQEPNILFLKYEDLKKDLPLVIRQVAQFLGKNLTEKQIEYLIKHLSFESMKNNRAVNYEPVVDLNKKYKLIEEEGCFMRSGLIGGYEAIMSAELITKFDLWIKNHAPTDGLGY